jgi:hypothetical protein
MSANGYLTEAELVHVSPVETLSTLAARAYRHLVIAGAAKGIKIHIASPGGAYRSFKTQAEMREGSLGNVALAAKWDLNPNSSVPLAAAGYSSHGFGTRVDLIFNGSSNPNGTELSLAAHYGFTREFGADDPNHFKHDGKTAITPLSAAEVAAAHLYPYENGVVPATKVYHTVVSGDTLSGIASAAHITLEALEKLNPQITNPNAISVGDKIRTK